MTEEQKTWIIARNRMMDALTRLGFPKELGEQIVRNLGSPKAMDRMTSYRILAWMRRTDYGR